MNPGMPNKSRTPLWITTGGLVFTLTAGFVNAIGFLGVHHHGLSHVSGQVTLVGIRLAEGDLSEAIGGVLVALWFFAGAVLSGIIIQRAELSRKGRRYGVAMLTEGSLLGVATYMLVGGNERGEYLAAMACGLQNAMATTYSGSILRTTHMTGVVTDLGIMVGHWVRREPLEGARVGLLFTLLSGFVTGGALGALAWLRLGTWALALPCVVMLLAGTVYSVTIARRGSHLRSPTA
jgi:uncharacterized membrane protein YoaK (UPF0700 family)